MLKISSKIFLFLIISYSGYCQQLAPEIPVLPGQFFNFQRLYNPASADPFHKAKASTAYQSYTGIRKNRKILFLDAYFSAGSKEKKRYNSCFGLTVAAQKTGSYINRNRFHFLYSYRTALSKAHHLIAGASLGIYNNFISENPSGISYSILSPDGNVSISVKHQKYAVSAGVNQIFNNRLNQERELLMLKRFYFAQLDYCAEFNMFQWENGLLLRIVPENRSYTSFYSILKYNKSIKGGIIFHENQGGIIGGISHTTKANNELAIDFSYHFPTGRNTIINSNTYNISLNLIMHRITF